jgi:2-polyprenyl-3-methyl-5-hydroxy-6-metoxy-1,4-benzoquinol methylase
MRCPVCFQTGTARFGEGRDALFGTTPETFSLVSCSNCRCLFIEPTPSPQEIASFYPPSYWWDGEDTGVLRRLEEVYRHIALSDHVSFISRAASNASPKGTARILDVGCGPATVLALLRSRGFLVQGLDMSSEAAAIAKRRYGVDVKVGTLDGNVFATSVFDVVVLLHTLEHVPDPHHVLREADRLLAPGGRLVIQVPNVDSYQCRVFGPRWYGLDVPRHLIDYSSDALLHLLGAHGFVADRVRHFNLRDNAPALASSLFPRLDPVGRAVRRRRKEGAESAAGTWIRHIVYLAAVVASYPPAVVEAVLGRGATLMVEARRK